MEEVGAAIVRGRGPIGVQERVFSSRLTDMRLPGSALLLAVRLGAGREGKLNGAYS